MSTSAEPPLVAGPVYGLRSWTVTRADGELRLAGPFAGTIWPPDKPLTAACRTTRHRAPRADCGCGIYAWHPTPHYARDVLAQGEAAGAVAGIVAAWGPVEVHAAGFRARHARVHALILNPRAAAKTAARVRALAHTYGAEVVTARRPREVLDYCGSRGLGLDSGAVRELLGPVERIERARRRRRRQRAMLLRAAGVVAGCAALAGIVAAWPAIESALRGPPAIVPKEVRNLTVLDQRVMPAHDGGIVYVAVVRNDDRRKAAMGVFLAGTLREQRGRVLAQLDSRLDVDVRPVIAPGGTSVVIDVLEDAGDISARVARFRTFPLARAFEAGAARDPVRVSGARFDSTRCVVTARVRSDRGRLMASVLMLAFDRRGRLDWGDLADVGPLPAGSSLQVLDRVSPEACAAPPARVAAYPNLSAGQVVRG